MDVQCVPVIIPLYRTPAIQGLAFDPHPDLMESVSHGEMIMVLAMTAVYEH